MVSLSEWFRQTIEKKIQIVLVASLSVWLLGSTATLITRYRSVTQTIQLPIQQLEIALNQSNRGMLEIIVIGLQRQLGASSVVVQESDGVLVSLIQSGSGS
jgi:hypothetical protein